MDRCVVRGSQKKEETFDVNAKTGEVRGGEKGGYARWTFSGAQQSKKK